MLRRVTAAARTTPVPLKDLPGLCMVTVLIGLAAWFWAWVPVREMKSGAAFNVHVSDGVTFETPSKTLEVRSADGSLETVKVLTSDNVTIPAYDAHCEPAKAVFPSKNYPPTQCSSTLRDRYGWPAWSPWLAFGVPTFAGLLTLGGVVGCITLPMEAIRRRVSNGSRTVMEPGRRCAALTAHGQIVPPQMPSSSCSIDWIEARNSSQELRWSHQVIEPK